MKSLSWVQLRSMHRRHPRFPSLPVVGSMRQRRERLRWSNSRRDLPSTPERREGSFMGCKVSLIVMISYQFMGWSWVYNGIQTWSFGDPPHSALSKYKLWFTNFFSSPAWPRCKFVTWHVFQQMVVFHGSPGFRGKNLLHTQASRYFSPWEVFKHQKASRKKNAAETHIS